MDIALRDHHTGHLESLGETWPKNGSALAPEPQTIGRLLPRLLTFIVEGMVPQDLKRGVHEFPQNIGSVSSGQCIGDRSTNQHMRVCTDRSRLPVDPYHEVTVA